MIAKTPLLLMSALLAVPLTLHAGVETCLPFAATTAKPVLAKLAASYSKPRVSILTALAAKPVTKHKGKRKNVAKLAALPICTDDITTGTGLDSYFAALGAPPTESADVPTDTLPLPASVTMPQPTALAPANPENTANIPEKMGFKAPYAYDIAGYPWFLFGASPYYAQVTTRVSGITPNSSGVPEPKTAALLAVGLLFLGFLVRKGGNSR